MYLHWSEIHTFQKMLCLRLLSQTNFANQNDSREKEDPLLNRKTNLLLKMEMHDDCTRHTTEA